tara:strand:- start:11378 stop:12400 length:1023 start_codon:yes stop_codon:yes gene_type:complete
MAGVSNQPNIKPLIDKQTQVQRIDFDEIKADISNILGYEVQADIELNILLGNMRFIKELVEGQQLTLDGSFNELRQLLSSEIDSNGDLTVANLTSFKNAIVEEVKNTESAINFTVSVAEQSVIDSIQGFISPRHGWITENVTNAISLIESSKVEILAGVTGVEGKINVVSGELENAKTSILSGVETAKTEVINSVNAAKTAVLNGVSGYVTAAKTAVLDEINSARVNILTTVSGYVTTAKNAVISAVNAAENRITANVNAKASGIKSVQRGVVTMDTALMTNVSISSVNLAKSTLIINERGSVGGFLSAANQIRFEKSPTASNYQDGDTAIIYWQVIEYV